MPGGVALGCSESLELSVERQNVEDELAVSIEDVVEERNSLIG